jgi:nicotinamidase-related amidase
MARVLRAAVFALLLIAALPLSGSIGARAQGATSQAPSLQVPAIPDPALVSLDSTTTAFLALDLLDFNCAPRPACEATLPAVAAGLSAARAANVPVVYSVVGGGNVLPDIAPAAGDPILRSFGADKFFNTDLDNMLRLHGITTVVVTGTSANGAVLYTSFAAAARGYTVVVATDGISSSSDFATQYTEWQLLNGPGTANAQNDPLKAKVVTLSRTDLISYR